jgi:hypothetical protein
MIHGLINIPRTLEPQKCGVLCDWFACACMFFRSVALAGGELVENPAMLVSWPQLEHWGLSAASCNPQAFVIAG